MIHLAEFNKAVFEELYHSLKQLASEFLALEIILEYLVLWLCCALDVSLALH